MEIREVPNSTPYEFAIIGRLDTNTSSMLEDFSKKAYEDKHLDIIVDMSECSFVSSAGLRVIVAMQKRASVKGSLVFKDVQLEVMDVFNMTGFDKILTFIESGSDEI